MLDRVVGNLDPDREDEILVYLLVSCSYLCLKVEGRLNGQPFAEFLGSVVRLPSYEQLRKHLAPEQDTLLWTEDFYPVLEQTILANILRFKTELVSGA